MSGVVNKWCSALGIEGPRLEAVKDHPEANTYNLMLVALLERGAPMTLTEVAARFEAAGIGTAESALASLKRCRPARPPAYRDGDHYSLDVHDRELDLWMFRLGLRPAKGSAVVAAPRPEPEPVPPLEVALTVRELDEAWTGANLYGWSSQRAILAVLDAAPEPMAPAEVVAFIHARTRWHSVRETIGVNFRREGAVVQVRADERWAVASSAGDAVIAARRAVRARLATRRERAALRAPPGDHEARRDAEERRRAARAADLATLRRALLVGFPAQAPRAVALEDVERREIATFIGDELTLLPEKLGAFDIIGAVDVRGLLRRLGVDPADRRLAELGPSQKTLAVGPGRAPLKLTTELVITSTCGIARPFGDPGKLAAWLESGNLMRVRERLEANVRALHALHAYGRLHGAARVRLRGIDERIVAPWQDPDEPSLWRLEALALEADVRKSSPSPVLT